MSPLGSVGADAWRPAICCPAELISRTSYGMTNETFRVFTKLNTCACMCVIQKRLRVLVVASRA
jgi:hypothetical protein